MSQILVRFADDHSADLLSALGKVVTAFGDLEQALWLTPKRIRNITLDDWKKTLADPERERRKKIPDRIKSIRKTYKQHHGREVPTDLSALLRDARKLSKERNNVIHALWARDMEGFVIRIRLGKLLPADVNTVADLAARVRRIRDRINDYPWVQPTAIAIPSAQPTPIPSAQPTPIQSARAVPAEANRGKRLLSRSVRCEVRRADGQWDQVSVEEAIGLGNGVEKRCIECHGPVRAHASHGGPSAHIEHRQAHTGCSLGDSFNGQRSLHPNALE